MSNYCNCEDWPCCGHGVPDGGRTHPLQGHLDPEDAEGWLEGLDDNERDFALRTMAPCPACGEMRPKSDPSIQRFGCCNMCSEDPARRRAPQAHRNLRFFSAMIDDRDDRIRELETEVERMRSSKADR